MSLYDMNVIDLRLNNDLTVVTDKTSTPDTFMCGKRLLINSRTFIVVFGFDQSD